MMIELHCSWLLKSLMIALSVPCYVDMVEEGTDNLNFICLLFVLL
jgi:hypothetical protein